MILPKLFQPLTQRSILPANRVTDLGGRIGIFIGMEALKATQCHLLWACRRTTPWIYAYDVIQPSP